LAGNPKLGGIYIILAQLMAAVVPMQEHSRSAGFEDRRETPGVSRRNNGVRLASTQKDSNAAKIRYGLGYEWNHCPKENSAREMLRVSQYNASRNVCTIGVPDREQFVFAEAVLAPGIFDELSEFLGASLQILKVEYPFSKPAEKPRHSVLEDFASEAQDCGAWKQLLTQRNQIVLIAASPVKQEQHRPRIAVAAWQKSMDKT
jgi:hypothetical protein